MQKTFNYPTTSGRSGRAIAPGGWLLCWLVAWLLPLAALAQTAPTWQSSHPPGAMARPERPLVVG